MSSCENESIGRLIYKTALNLRNYLEKMLSPHDLTVEQFHILKNASVNLGLNQNQLCEQVGKKPANITRILDRLEKKSWIERRANPNDRRSSLIFLTDGGEQVVAKVSKGLEGYSDWFTRGITYEEIEFLKRVLSRIDDNIYQLMDEIDGEGE